MSASIDALIPELADAARALDSVVHNSGLQGRFTSTLRTSAEQKRLYDAYLRGENQFPALPPGQSAHEFGWAFDYVVSPYDYQLDVGSFWVENGGVWHAGDAVHFEYPGFVVPPTQESLHDWILRVYGEIPWWLSLLLPLGMTMQDSAKPATQKKVTEILRSAGF